MCCHRGLYLELRATAPAPHNKLPPRSTTTGNSTRLSSLRAPENNLTPTLRSSALFPLRPSAAGRTISHGFLGHCLWKSLLGQAVSFLLHRQVHTFKGFAAHPWSACVVAGSRRFPFWNVVLLFSRVYLALLPVLLFSRGSLPGGDDEDGPALAPARRISAAAPLQWQAHRLAASSSATALTPPSFSRREVEFTMPSWFWLVEA